MHIAALCFNPICENTYVVWDDTLECVILDAGCATPDEQARLADFIARRGLRPVLAANTHGHFDHTMGVEWVKRTYGVPFALSRKDQFLLDDAEASAARFGVACGPAPAIDTDLDTTPEVRFGQSALRVIPTPGHTPGHVSFHAPQQQVLFTGDTLFRESIGRTDLPGGDYAQLMRSILEGILPLGDATAVHPGHGEATTLGHEALYNPFVVEALNREVDYSR